MMKWSMLALVAVVSAEQDTIRWLNDFKQASFEAKQTGKPMFVVFR
jgi:hypothetical protein